MLVNPDGSFNYAATDDRVIWKYTANSPYIRASKPVYSKSTYVLNLTHISKIAEDLDMTAQLFAPNREWHISVSEPICCFPDGFYSVSYNVEKQPQALLSLPNSLVSALVMCDNSEDVSIIEPSMVARSKIRFNKVGITTLHLSAFALQRNMECTDCSFNTDIKSTTFRQTGEFVKCDFNGNKLALTGKDITLTLNNVSNIAVDMNIYTDIVPHQVSDARLTLMDTHIPEGDFHFKSSDAAPYLTISALNSTIRLPDMCYPEGSLTIKEFGTGSVTWDKLEFGSIQLHPSSSAKEKAIFKPRTKSQLLNVLLSSKANHPTSWVLDLRECEVGNSLQLSAELGAKFQIEAIYLPPVQRLEILTSILGFLHGPIVLSDTKHIRIKNDVHLMVVGIKSDDQPMTIADDEFTVEGPLSATERFWAAFKDAGY